MSQPHPINFARFRLPGATPLGSIRLCLCALALSFGFGCGGSASRPKPEPGLLKVAVSILPQAYFVERIGGPHVDVTVLVGPGQSPATYEPTPRQMTVLAGARLFFRIGVAFEQRLLTKLHESHPNLEIVDGIRGINRRHLAGHDHGDHADGHVRSEGEDPHVWLDPRLVKVQARTMCDALKRCDPAHAADYERNLSEFHADLDRLHAEISKRLRPHKGRGFFVFHPAFGYLADAYGLKQIPIETGGKEPTAKRLSALIEQARAAGIKRILVQRQFAGAGASAVAVAIGGDVVEVDPLAFDYFENLRSLASNIAISLEEAAPKPTVSFVPRNRRTNHHD